MKTPALTCRWLMGVLAVVRPAKPVVRSKSLRHNHEDRNLRTVQPLLGHTKMDSTVRYLGAELEDAFVVAEF